MGKRSIPDGIVRGNTPVQVQPDGGNPSERL